MRSAPIHGTIVVPVLTAAAAAAVSDLAARPGTTVVAVAIDVGQAVPLEELREIALAAGALRCHAFERRDRLADAYLWPALRAGIVGEAGEPVLKALSAPCVADAVVEVAVSSRPRRWRPPGLGARAPTRCGRRCASLAPTWAWSRRAARRGNQRGA